KQYSYEIWGNPITTQEAVFNPFRYSGEYWDTTAGLQYLRARWYDPNVGRFISEDTYEGDITNPLSLNLYTYVHNNPLKYDDYTGHRPAYIYHKDTGYYEYMSSLEFFDGLTTAYGYVPFG